MIEDKLSHDERLRLECLNQAVALSRLVADESLVIEWAEAFEKFVKGS